MLTKQWALQITGQPKNYKVHLEVFGEVDSLSELRDSLRGLLGNIRLTTTEVDTDLATTGSYEARSMSTAPVAED